MIKSVFYIVIFTLLLSQNMAHTAEETYPPETVMHALYTGQKVSNLTDTPVANPLMGKDTPPSLPPLNIIEFDALRIITDNTFKAKNTSLPERMEEEKKDEGKKLQYFSDSHIRALKVGLEDSEKILQWIDYLTKHEEELFHALGKVYEDLDRKVFMRATTPA